MNIHIPEINKNNVDIRFSGATKSMSRDRVSEIGKCCIYLTVWLENTIKLSFEKRSLIMIVLQGNFHY